MACDDPWPRNDWASNLALAVTTLGMVLVVVGCLWPIDTNYMIDPTLTAVENERREADFVWRINTLFLVSVMGMALLVLGGVITTAVICRMMWMEDSEPYPEANRTDHIGMSETHRIQQVRSDKVAGSGTRLPDNRDTSDEVRLVEKDQLQDYGSTLH